MAGTRVIGAGVQRAFLAFVSNDKNIITGGTTTAPANGSVSDAIQLVGIQSAPTGIPEGDVVSVEGDDTILGSFQFDSVAPATFIISTGENDLLKDALLQSTLVESVNDMQIGVLRPTTQELPDVCLLIQGRAKDTGANGASAYMAYFYPRCTIQPLGRTGFDGRTAGAFTYQVVAQPVSNQPTGATLTEAINGTGGATVLAVNSNYPLTMARITGDNTTLAFTLGKQPANATTSNAVVGINGVKTTTGYTFNTVTNQIVFAVAPALGAKVVVIYGYQGS